MEAALPLEKPAELLFDTIHAEWEQDITFSASLGAEGERVRDNALALVHAVRSGTLRDVIGGASVSAYLGQGWLEVHFKSHEQADTFQAAAEHSGAL